MQTNLAFKNFACKHHPSEIIQGVADDEDYPPTLICFKCIMEQTASISKMKVQKVEDYLNATADSYDKYIDNLKVDGKMAKEVASILKTENEVIEALKIHINKEKVKINENLNTILENFIKSFNDVRDEIFTTLEIQPKKLKLLYDRLAFKLDRFYFQSEEKTYHPTKIDLINKAHFCKNAEELEKLLRNLYKDIQEAITFTKHPEKLREVELEIKDLESAISEQSAFLPKSLMGSMIPSIQGPIRLFKENVKTFLNTLSYIEPVIEDKIKSHTFSTVILSDYSEMALLLDWLQESGYKKPVLVYRGSRDGFTSKAFHRNCDDYSPNLVLIKSNYGRVFGGFTDQTWNSTSSAKGSAFSWLFSLDERIRFPVKKEYKYCAIFAKEDYGPTFGNAFDLYLADEFRSEMNYSNLGKGYEPIGLSDLDDTCRLAGNYYFSVEEIEVFAFDDADINVE